MKPPIHIDFETYSEANLKNVGAFKYAEHPSTEILALAVSEEGEENPIHSWDVTLPTEGNTAVELLGSAMQGERLVYAHNVMFEIPILWNLCLATFGFDWCPDVTIYRCTAAMCRRAAIPSQLGQACEFLGLSEQKDKEGQRLIRKFSVPRKPTKKDRRTRILPQDDPEDFQKFVEYCQQDVTAEKQLHAALPLFELKCSVLKAFQMDIAMNLQGIPANIDALQKAQRLCDKFTERETEKFTKLTHLKPTQRDKVLEWAKDRGYPFPKLNAEMVGRFMGNPGPDPSEQLLEALRLRKTLSYAATKKIKKMMDCVCGDGFIRGVLLFAGAERTHRWSGKLIQPQNFKRSTRWSPLAYRDICEGASLEEMETFWGDILRTLATCIRHFIQFSDKEILQADFSAVEARGVAWLCEEEETLEMFRRKEPIYERMGAKIFGVSVQQVIEEHKSRNDTKRFVGKQAILGCGYQMGSPRFRATCEGYGFKPTPEMVEHYKPRFRKQLSEMRSLTRQTEQWDEWQEKFPPYSWAECINNKGGPTFKVWAYKINGKRRLIREPDSPTEEEWLDLTYDDLAKRAVETFREANPKIKAAWKSIDTAAKDAIRNPGKEFWGTPKIRFRVTEKVGFRALVMFLPGGHNLIYPLPSLVWKGKPSDGEPDYNNNFLTQITFFGRINEAMSSGAHPKFPNMTGWGRNTTYGGSLLENATQAICGDLTANGAYHAWQDGYLPFMLIHDEALTPKKDSQAAKNLCNLLCKLPDWAEGFPLEAEGNVIPFYMKT